MACYVYAVVEAEHASSMPADAEAVAVDGLVAVVREVDAREYEQPALDRHLADVDWLESEVRAHERVVEALLGDHPVVPMRFGSIFSTPSDVERLLADHSGEFQRLLDRVRGRHEWDVKVHVDASALTRQLITEPPDASPGRTYLLRRQAERQAREHGLAAAAQVAD